MRWWLVNCQKILYVRERRRGVLLCISTRLALPQVFQVPSPPSKGGFLGQRLITASAKFSTRTDNGYPLTVVERILWFLCQKEKQLLQAWDRED